MKSSVLYQVLKVQYGPVAQLVRAPPCHGGGHEFESRLGRLSRKRQFIENYGVLAQLGEHLPYKQRVTGSSPVGPIQFQYGWIPEWPKGTDCKSAANCFGGSNPPPSISLKAVTINAGWSSLEARRAHNPKVIGSNPIPATMPSQLSWQSKGLKILVSLVRFRNWARTLTDHRKVVFFCAHFWFSFRRTVAYIFKIEYTVLGLFLF